MTAAADCITKEECAAEIRLLARRLALLHYYYAEAIIGRLGEQEGRALIKEAIWAYGRHCGDAVRAEVEALCLPLTAENYARGRDLPRFGWESGTVTLPDGEVRSTSLFCPIAATLQELGPRGMALGRLYCFVDQAKFEAYNPAIAFAHARNVLDGDACCEFAVLTRAADE